jgi:hypothetical protein
LGMACATLAAVTVVPWALYHVGKALLLYWGVI